MALELAQLQELIDLLKRNGVERYENMGLVLVFKAHAINNTNIEPESVAPAKADDLEFQKRLNSLPQHLRGLFDVT